jgi:hypothetical protein
LERLHRSAVRCANILWATLKLVVKIINRRVNMLIIYPDSFCYPCCQNEQPEEGIDKYYIEIDEEFVNEETS